MTFLTLQERIELERGKRDASEILELNLDNAKSVSIDGLTDEYTSLEVLSMVNVGLEGLSGMPLLPSLKSLELSKNKLSIGLTPLLHCPAIEQLNLSNNNIEDVNELKPLAKLADLRSLDLSNNPIATCESYRKKVFTLIPSLKYLDGMDENNEEEPASNDNANGVIDDGDCFEGVDEEEDDDDDEDDDDSECEDDEEEIGLEALQQSGELDDDDEDDYAPGDDEEAELDDYDDDEDEDDLEEDVGANLSGAGVTGPRRSTKRRADDAETGPHPSKRKSVDGHVKNGSPDQ